MNEEIEGEKEMEHEDENFIKGLFWAILLSIPLWLSFFGWIKIIKNLLHI